jgi:hypothetical protein
LFLARASTSTSSTSARTARCLSSSPSPFQHGKGCHLQLHRLGPFLGEAPLPYCLLLASPFAPTLRPVDPPEQPPLPQAGAEEASARLEVAARKEPMKEKTPRVDQAELLASLPPIRTPLLRPSRRRGRLGRRVSPGGCTLSAPVWRTARGLPSAALLGPSAPALTLHTAPIPPIRLLRRSFALDVLACGRCGGRLRVLAYLTAPGGCVPSFEPGAPSSESDGSRREGAMARRLHACQAALPSGARQESGRLGASLSAAPRAA